MDATAKHSSWILRLLLLLQYYSSQVCIHASTLSVFFARERGTLLVCIHDAPALRLKNENSSSPHAYLVASWLYYCPMGGYRVKVMIENSLPEEHRRLTTDIAVRGEEDKSHSYFEVRHMIMSDPTKSDNYATIYAYSWRYSYVSPRDLRISFCTNIPPSSFQNTSQSTNSTTSLRSRMFSLEQSISSNRVWDGTVVVKAVCSNESDHL